MTSRWQTKSSLKIRSQKYEPFNLLNAHFCVPFFFRLYKELNFLQDV
jgi:hypothetical protein